VVPRLQWLRVAVDALCRVGVEGATASRRVMERVSLPGHVRQRRVDDRRSVRSQRRLVLPNGIYIYI